MKSLWNKFKSCFKGKSQFEEYNLSTLNSHADKGIEDEEKSSRGYWGSRTEFLLSCIGLSVGFGNIWRFPYLAYENGGAAFLIPYTILLLIIGKPIYFLEVAIGQFSSLSAVAVWRCCPIAKGVGIAMQIVCFCTCIYYNVLVAYTVFYAAASMAEKLPWTSCDDWWGADESCFVRKPGIHSSCTDNMNSTPGVHCDNSTRQTASEQYWVRYVLHMHQSSGIGDPVGVRWDLTLCLLFAWIVVFICLFKGIKSSGKVVYFTATFPYAVLIVLLIRGVTLEGAGIGLKYLFIPDWNKLLEVKVWQAAAEQMFFSLGISWGSLIMFGSYNRFHNKVHIDAFIVSLTDFLTSLIGCIAIFSVLGYLANQLNLDVSKVVSSGPGLAFVVYPEALALLPVSQLWSILFFFMLFTLGLDSQFALLEGIISNIYDHWKGAIKYKIVWTLVSSIVLFLLGLTCVTNGGQYVFNLLDAFGATQSVLIISLFEMISFMWIYGAKRLIHDLEFMLEMKLTVWFWWTIWAIICPLFLVVILVLSFINTKPLTYGKYVYPDWAQYLGWCIEFLSVIQIPIWGIIILITYWLKGDILGAFRPTTNWGPANAKIFMQWKQSQQSKNSGTENPAFSNSVT